MRPALLLLLLPLALCAACLRQTEFHCTVDNQCNPGGKCQAAVGFCSFSDSACASGQRFGEGSGPYTNLCVGDQPGGDGGIDAPTDTPAAACPSNYMVLPGAPAGSHVYGRAPQVLNWDQQRTSCASITAGKGYLAIPDDAAELSALFTLAGNAESWVGISDQAAEGQFVTVRGTPQTFLPWAGGVPNGGTNENCVAAVAATISDERCSGGGAGTNRPAVCECEP